jgi:hypothetical protein
MEAFFEAQLGVERYNEKTPIGPPLTPPQATQQLRAIATATTSADKDARLSLEKDEKKGKYQLQKSEETDRYCFRGQWLRREKPSWGRAQGDAAPDPLLTVALGLRCGATAEERKKKDEIIDKVMGKNAGKNAEKLPPKEVIESPSLTVLDTEQQCTHMPETPRSDLTEYLRQYCQFVADMKNIAYGGAAPEHPEPSPISIKILTRSTDEVLGYLGRVAGFSYEEKGDILVPEYSNDDPKGDDLASYENCGEHKQFKCFKLLVVSKKKPAGRALVSVSYDDETYWVPRDEPGSSSAVFEVVHQLLSLAKVAKDLAAGNIITVAPLP